MNVVFPKSEFLKKIRRDFPEMQLLEKTAIGIIPKGVFRRN